MGPVWEQLGGDTSSGKLRGPGQSSQPNSGHSSIPCSSSLPTAELRLFAAAAPAERIYGTRSNPGPIPVGRQRGKGGWNKKTFRVFLFSLNCHRCLTLSFESTAIHSWHLPSISSPAFCSYATNLCTPAQSWETKESLTCKCQCPCSGSSQTPIPGKLGEKQGRGSRNCTRCEISPMRWGGNVGRSENPSVNRKNTHPLLLAPKLSSLEVGSNRSVREKHQFWLRLHRYGSHFPKDPDFDLFSSGKELHSLSRELTLIRALNVNSKENSYELSHLLSIQTKQKKQ